MKKEEYIKAVLEQVRCSDVHEPLKKELEAHIDDQAEAFISVGLPEENAEEEAVKTMGDPIETGMGLDAAHRPSFPMAVFLPAVILLFTGILARYFFEDIFPVFDIMKNDDIINMIACIAAAIIFYFADYTIFVRKPKTAYVVCTLLLAITVIWNVSKVKGENVSGAEWVTIVFRNTLSGYLAFYGSALLVPLMCGFVFSMRGKNFKWFVLSCFVLVVPPAFISLYAPCLSGAILVGIAALAIMTTAVKEGYFNMNKTAAYLFMYIPASLAAVGLTLIKLLRNIRYNGSTADWEQDMIRELITEAVLFGNNGRSVVLTDPYNSHILTAIIARFGLVAGLAVAVILVILPLVMIIMSSRIQNRFGRLTAISIGVVFLFMSSAFIAANFGFTTAMESHVTAPFMSDGIFNAVTSGILMGIFASVYRRKDLMPERKIDTDRPAQVC
ncbi:MAG: permease prefix domain 1-containing protein [Oscillospiraceae bacterium]